MLKLVRTQRRCLLESPILAFSLLACIAAGCVRPEQERIAAEPTVSREAVAQPPQLAADDSAKTSELSENDGSAIQAEQSDETPAGLDVGEIDTQLESEGHVELPDRFEGSEIIARVGPEVILASDVLYDANQYLQRAKKYAPHTPTACEIEQARKVCMSTVLKKFIKDKLAVIDGRRSLPTRHWEAVETEFNIQFARDYMPKLLAAEGCGSLAELDSKLHEAGTSLEAQRHQLWESSFARYWVIEAAKDDREISQQEVEDYFRTHHADYETPTRARWRHLTVRFDKPDTNQDEARTVIAGAYQKLKAGTSFEEVAKTNPEKLSIDDENAWIEKGSLVSEALDKAMFTLPTEQLSEILEDDRGVHVILVIEREEGSVTSLADVESAIREKIKDERNLVRRNEYQAKLEKTIPVWNAFKEAGIGTEFNESAKALSAPAGPAESPAAGKTPANYLNTGLYEFAIPELFRGDGPQAERTSP